VREEAGLAPESEEEGEEKLPVQGIGERLTEDGGSTAARSSGRRLQWGIWARVRGEKGKLRPRCRRGRIRASGGRARHGSRGWPARGGVFRRRQRAWRAARQNREREGMGG
jgi:hypothetical protein